MLKKFLFISILLTTISILCANNISLAQTSEKLQQSIIPTYARYLSSESEWREWSNKAINWAEKCMKDSNCSKSYRDYCLTFVAEAFIGASKQDGRDAKGASWESPKDAIKKLGNEFYSGNKNPPRGALVFFSGQGDYSNYGHIGIYLGNDRVIHAYGVVKKNSIGEIENLTYIDSYLGWAYPPKAWFGARRGIQDEQKNALRNELQKWEKLITQTQFEDISKRINIIARTWRVITDKATGVKLNEDYQKLYGLAKNYLDKARSSINESRTHFERGELDQAKSYLSEAQKNLKIAQDTYQTAIQVLQGQLEAGEILAKGLQQASDVALTGLAALVPGAQQVVDRFLLVRDFIADSSMEGINQASKEAIVKIAISKVFNEFLPQGKPVKGLGDIDLSKLSGRLTEDPNFRRRIENEILKAISQYIAEDKAAQITQRFMNQFAKFLQTQASASVDKAPNVTSFSASSFQINQGQSVTLSYSVSDDVGLNRVELWRADDTAGVGFREIKRVSISGKSYTGSFSDTPTSAGTYRYGVHVVDTSGKWNDERNSQTGSSPGVYGPKQVVVRTTVTPLAHGPTPSPSEGSFVQPCPDAGGYRSWLGGPNKNHLGHDYNAPAGTPVRAIADGTIVYANLNVSGFGGSEPDKPGPMMWIRHRLSSGKYFYALYGHIKPIKMDGDVKIGETIGTIIPFYIGKDYCPHLHLGIWNSESNPPLTELGYGSPRNFTNPIKFLGENRPYIGLVSTPSDIKAPNVTSFSASASQINQGQSVTLSYSVMDDVGLKQVELWRADDTVGVGFREIKRVTVSGKSYSGSFSDTPTSAGTYRYGIHVVDTANKWNCERNSQTGSSPGVYGPKQVVVKSVAQPPPPVVDKHPNVNSFSASASGINQGQSVTLSYSVVDDVGLKQVELWRADDTAGVGFREIKRAAVLGKQYSGSISDTPTSAGTYRYGVHVVDTSGKWNCERNSQTGSSPGVYGPKQVVVAGAPTVDKPPNVTSFSASSSQINQGQSVTLSYSVVDDVGLKQVELWRADDTAGVGFREIKRAAVLGKQYSGSISDTPTSAGTYRYGVHVVDTSGKWNCERNSQTNNSPGQYGPKQVVVGAPTVDKPPNVTSFSASSSQINQGQSVTLSYSVVDDVGLKQVELWRADDTAGVGFREIKRVTVSGTSYSGSISDTPSSPGTYRYGVHVVDTSGKWNCERNSQTNYSPGQFGPKQVVVVGAPTVDKPPNVTSFSASSSQITQGQSVTLSFSVTDDVGLKQVELWRADDTVGVGFREIKRMTVSGKSYSGSFSDTATSAGTYRYGVHVVDTKGQWNCERNSQTGFSPGVYGPRQVVVVGTTVTPPPVSPTLSMTPPSGAVGTTFTQTGKGFSPNRTATLFGRNPDGTVVQVTTVNTDSAGSFTTTWTAQTAGNNLARWAVDNATGKKSNEIVFNVTSAIPTVDKFPNVTSFSASASQITQGQSITLSYSVSDDVGLSYVRLVRADDSTKIDFREIRRLSVSGSSYSGSFTDTPPSAGTYRYGVHVVDTKGQWNCERNSQTGFSPGVYGPRQVVVAGTTVTPPPVSPTLSMTPPSGAVGTTFTQTGKGFSPNRTATLFGRNPDGTVVQVTTVNTDSAGSFTSTWTAQTAGNNLARWAVDNHTGQKSNEIVFNVTSAIPTVDKFPNVTSFSASASQITQGQSITLSYSVSDDVGLSYVRLVRADDSTKIDFREIRRLSVSGSSYSGSFTDTPPSAGTYRYGVHVVDTKGQWNCERNSQTNFSPGQYGPKQVVVVGVPTVSRPSPPKPISPGITSEPGTLINTLTPTLQWTAVPNADYYALAISIYPYGTGNIVYNPQKIYGTSITVPSGYLVRGKKYRWNMQAYNSAGLSSVSEPLYFQTPP